MKRIGSVQMSGKMCRRGTGRAGQGEVGAISLGQLVLRRMVLGAGIREDGKATHSSILAWRIPRAV